MLPNGALGGAVCPGGRCTVHGIAVGSADAGMRLKQEHHLRLPRKPGVDPEGIANVDSAGLDGLKKYL